MPHPGITLLVLGKGNEISLGIMPKYGEDLEKKRKEPQQMHQREGRRRKMCDKRGIHYNRGSCDTRGSCDIRKECDKERCNGIAVPEGMQVV